MSIFLLQSLRGLQFCCNVTFWRAFQRTYTAICPSAFVDAHAYIAISVLYQLLFLIIFLIIIPNLEPFIALI